MEEQRYSPTVPGGRTPPVPPPADTEKSDGLSRYLTQNMDFDGLAGDIRTLVEERLQQSMPDDRKIILDLASQMGKLTDEVRLLRKQIESNTAEAYPIVDISGELAEIKQMLADSPARSLPETPPPRRSVSELSAEELAERLGMTPPPRPTAAPEPAPTTTATAVMDPPVPPAAPTPPAPAPDPTAEEPADKPANGRKEKKKPTAMSIISNIVFYAMLFGIVFGAFLLKSGSGGQPTVIAGYSAFTVLTSSMEDTYPKGSLIITKSVPSGELNVGDDITFMVSETSTITHRIIGITENYLNTGDRAFETQGTMNEKADKDPVAAANVVGKVIWSNQALGKMASFVSTHWQLMLIYAVVLIGLFAFLKWNFSRSDDEDPKPKHMCRRGK